MTTETPAPIGHNAAPENADALTERLRQEHAADLARKDALLDAFTRVPETIDDEETAAKATDFVKQITAAGKNAEAARVKAKEPFLDSSRKVDGFFKSTIAEPLDRIKAKVLARLTVYQQAKDAAERRRREEQAAAERRAAREAAEAAERARQEAAAQAAAMQTPAELDDAVEAEIAATQRQAEADQRAADAARAAAQAAAKPADLSRTRSDMGSVASLVKVMTFDSLDREAIDLEKLRPHLTEAAIEAAVRAFIKAGGRDLKGVRIFETTTTRVA